MSTYQSRVTCKLFTPKKWKKYTDLNIEVKQQWQVEAMCTLAVTVPTVVPHMPYK